MKIVVVGLGYVGLSNAVLLAQHNEVIGVDVLLERVDKLNERKSPIIDVELSKYLIEMDLNLSASTDLKSSVKGADYVIISTPTNYDEKLNFFDTSSVEVVISKVIKSEPSACIVVKSTIPVGFTEDVKERLETDAVIFSPEFLREGMALYDNLYPSRIIIGEKSKRAEVFASLMAKGALKSNVDILFTGSREAEAIKLFSNTYLAMRVAFFNELDSYALVSDINSREIIDGVSLDPRIGHHYNNPSFGYGGYCLPKDTKQLLANYNSIPQSLISAIVSSNSIRQKHLANIIKSQNPNVVGIYLLAMKHGSDNYRDSSIIQIMSLLDQAGINLILYEPSIDKKYFKGIEVNNDYSAFIQSVDLVICNRLDAKIREANVKIFSRDLFESN